MREPPIRRRSGRRPPLRPERGQPDAELRLLSPSASEMLHHLCDVYGALGKLLPEAREMTPFLDLVAENSREGRHIARGLRETVRLILREAAGSDDGHPVETAGAAGGGEGNGGGPADQLELTPDLAAASTEEITEVDAASAFVAAAALIAEVGYCEYVARVFPVPMPDGSFALSWIPLTREAAAVALVERVMERLELWASREEIGAFEREASRYWFERFSAPPTDQGLFARTVREQEFTVAGRPFVSLGDTVAHSYQVARGRTLPAAVRRVLRGLVQSWPSLFVVRRREGRSALMEDLRDGRTHVVVEHNDELIYEPGFAALGRLLPVGGGRHLRSPGMFLAEWPDVNQHGRETLASAGKLGLAPELLLEGMFAASQGQKVPRQIRPAPSRKAAEEMLFDFSMAMREGGSLGRRRWTRHRRSFARSARSRGGRCWRCRSTRCSWSGLAP